MDLNDLWNKCWSKELNDRLKETSVPMEDWKAGGRPSKTFPNKEDSKWWAKNGPKQLENWVQFRGNHWNIFELSGVPCIEIDLLAVIEGVPVKMQIDRVMVTPEGELVIVDIKSGRTTPNWLQLAFYAAGMDIVFGIRPKWGTYWMARSGTTSPMIDLDLYPTEDIVSLVKKFDVARRNDIFLPNLSHCSRCGFNKKCKWNK
jgi:hypothetical protein